MPENVSPEFGGKCAFAVALAGPDKAPQGDVKYALEQDGKTYFFKGAFPRWLFKAFGMAARAQAKGAAAR
jgi:hypothetical protein